MAMERLGTVESLWRYPVKSMRGEALDEAVVLYSGLYGDRIAAFIDGEPPRSGFPFFTGRQLEAMLLYTPRFRHPERARRPANWDDAAALPPGATSLFPEDDGLDIVVETPSGQRLAIGDPALLSEMRGGKGSNAARLARSDRSLTDCRPVSIFSLQTNAQLAAEIAAPVDKRQFRANIYADFAGQAGFAENGLIGKRVRVGEKVELAVLDLDPRCKMITIHPETAECNRELLHQVIGRHGGMAGLYAAVLVEGVVRPGDMIEVLD